MLCIHNAMYLHAQNIDEATQAAEDERVNNAKTLAEIQVG